MKNGTENGVSCSVVSLHAWRCKQRDKNIDPAGGGEKSKQNKKQWFVII